MKNLVSVIVPTYKRIKILARCIQSVLNQSHKDFELLIVNDDQDDDKQIIELITDFKDSRIKYFRNERTKGANGARNTGITNSNGKFIAFLDDDDEWLPDKLKTQINCLKDKPDNYAGVYSAYLIERNNNWEKYFGRKEGKILSEVILDKVKICTGSNLLINSNAIEKVGLWDEELLRQQDLEFLVRFLKYYDLAYDNNIVAKIYGHNTPNPRKAFKERGKYLQKISSFLNTISLPDKNQFLSDHFRRQAIFLFKLKENEKAFDYWSKAKKIKYISLKKDIKLWIHYIKSISNRKKINSYEKK